MLDYERGQSCFFVLHLKLIDNSLVSIRFFWFRARGASFVYHQDIIYPYSIKSHLPVKYFLVLLQSEEVRQDVWLPIDCQLMAGSLSFFWRLVKMQIEVLQLTLQLELGLSVPILNMCGMT